MVSIDEKLLEEICGTPMETGLNFIVDGNNCLIACSNSEEIGKTIAADNVSEEEKQDAHIQAAKDTGLFGDRELLFIPYMMRKQDGKLFVL